MKALLVIGAFGLVLWLLCGCATDVNPGPCPPLKGYTPEQNQKLADEIDALPGDAITIDIIADYMTLRDQVRACQ